MNKITSLIVFLVFAAGFCFAENLLPDNLGSFESEDSLAKTVFMWKPAGMELGELCRITKNESYCGRSALELHAKYPEYYGVFAQARGDVFKAGETYTASAYVRAPEPANIFIYLITYDELWKTSKGDKFYYTKIGPEWKQIKVTFKLPKDAKILGTIVRIGGDETSPRTFYVDELKIEPGADATAIEPGRVEAEEQLQAKGIIPSVQTPALDGRLSDPAWKNALTTDKFYLTDGSGKAAPQRTEVKMMYDDKNIYFGFKCEEKNVGAMKCDSTPEKTYWSDDRVEIHANPLGYAGQSAYFSINADGVYTTKMPLGDQNLKPEIKTAKGNGFWTAEIAIPAAAYGKAGLTGQTWYFSIGRFHRTSFKGASCIAPIKGGFNTLPEAFQPFVFSDDNSLNLPPVMTLTQGDMAGYSNNTGGNALVFQLNDKKLLAHDLELAVTSAVNGKTVAVQELTAKPPFKNNRAVFYYNTADKENEILNFTLKSEGKAIFSSGNDLNILCPPCRVFRTASPLFQELVKNGPVEKRIFFSWQHPVSEDNYSLALKYAKPYSQEQRLRELKDAGISIMSRDATDLYKSLPSVLPGNYYWDREKLNMAVLSKKVETGEVLPFTVYAYYNISGISPAGEKGVTLDKNGYFGWPPDPVNRQAHKDGVKAVLDKYGPSIGIMWAGDEQFWVNHDQGLKMNSPHNQANKTGFLEKAEKEVKDKYGFGKFGIPWGMDSKSPDYPYCKRAYISWLHDKLLAVNKDTRALVKAKYPDMLIMSDDAYGVPSVAGVQYWYQYADIGTFQLGEGGVSAERQIEQYAFSTKMVKDLSGVKKLSVCPHEALDGYPSTTTLEEARELYSQALRGGTDGFQYWPASFGGQDKPPVYAAAVSEGYPLSWQYMLEVTRLLNNMPPLKFPESADTAIFVSDEALKCDSSCFDRFSVAFALLGTSAHAWFKFISDTMLEQDRAKLSDYKIIYMPYIQYVKEDTIKRLIEYVENGGTLICGDPKAFENDISSAPLAQYREKLFGVKAIVPDNSPAISCRIGSRKLPVDGDRFRLQLDGKARVIGSYADGVPAVVEKWTGKGKALYFGFVPFSRVAVGSSDWKDFMKELHVAQGGTVGYDIWRFKLPEPTVKPAVNPSGKCLTGNYAYWNRHRLNDGTIFNLKLDGVCEINRNGKTQSSSFKDSKLTDRRSIFTRVKEYGSGTPDKFVETFDQSGADSIIIDLKDKFQLDRLVLYYAGELPEMTVSVSGDKEAWTPAGQIPSAKTTPQEVGEAIFKFSDANSRFVKLDFSTREKLILAELELWRK
ncbi:MAG: beta-galactosidase trimerization domain-containing protein [Victivallaceae bacterium]|jgi:hypothetical protein